MYEYWREDVELRKIESSTAYKVGLIKCIQSAQADCACSFPQTFVYILHKQDWQE